MKINSILFFLIIVAFQTSNAQPGKPKHKDAPSASIPDGYKNLVTEFNKRTACTIEYLDDYHYTTMHTNVPYLIKKGTISNIGFTTLTNVGNSIQIKTNDIFIGSELSDKTVNGIRKPNIYYSSFNLTFSQKNDNVNFILKSNGDIAETITKVTTYNVPNITGRWENKYCIEFNANGGRVRISFVKARSTNDK
ncbi:hypothetical protein EZJ43_11450 [Pedobacter changchengzhani]|uniref:DUF4251 domain-containing protein n=1 Tax=Pedobacter changchengzhani TaxID=2529274 RepID=A0A4R5MKL3_9SPHI|nr:hypothetical protein [Pedobacter changchengzhani]TDG35956.1 hypothetical protein EZJ43_11450 [Pedobacter changchengzhani]